MQIITLSILKREAYIQGNSFDFHASGQRKDSYVGVTSPIIRGDIEMFGRTRRWLDLIADTKNTGIRNIANGNWMDVKKADSIYCA